MIHTSLARRISPDSELNNISLFLPYFNEETIKNVVNALRDSEAVMPSETGTNKDFITLVPSLAYSDVFDAMDKLITYPVDSSRKQAPLKLLIQISRALTMDGINLGTQKTVKNAVLSKYEDNKRAMARINEARKNIYERLINASAQPISVPWILPDSIDFYLPEDSIKFEQHLYCNKDDTFQTSLNKWESAVIEEELKNGAICWLRNLDCKKWSLEVPYEVSGVTTNTKNKGFLI